MVEMLKQNIRKIRHFTTLVSIVLTVIALGALGFKGLNLGLDFTGGMVTEVKVDKQLTNQWRTHIQRHMSVRAHWRFTHTVRPMPLSQPR